MSKSLQLHILTTAGRLNRQQEGAIDFLREKNRILHDRLGSKRIHFTDPQRKWHAMHGKRLGRQVLAGPAGIATQDPIPRRYR